MTQNQPTILIHIGAKSPISIIMILEVSKKQHCKLDKILGNFVSNIICDFQLFLSNTQVYVAFQFYFTNKGSFFSDTTVFTNFRLHKRTEYLPFEKKTITVYCRISLFENVAQ